jgi:hypothetical protein
LKFRNGLFDLRSPDRLAADFIPENKEWISRAYSSSTQVAHFMFVFTPETFI